MSWTIRISQKHIERAIFILIILVLLGILLAERLDVKIFNIDFGSQIKKTNSTTTTISLDTSTSSSSTSSNSQQSTSTSISFTTTTGSVTTTTSLDGDLEFAVGTIMTTKVDSTKGTIDTVDISIKNNMDDDLDLVIKYYIYDETSGAAERTTPKRPYINIGVMKHGEALSETYDINRTVFNINYEKTIKFELVDESADITKTVIKKIRIY